MRLGPSECLSLTEKHTEEHDVCSTGERVLCKTQLHCNALSAGSTELSGLTHAGGEEAKRWHADVRLHVREGPTDRPQTPHRLALDPLTKCDQLVLCAYIQPGKWMSLVVLCCAVLQARWPHTGRRQPCCQQAGPSGGSLHLEIFHFQGVGFVLSSSQLSWLMGCGVSLQRSCCLFSLVWLLKGESGRGP